MKPTELDGWLSALPDTLRTLTVTAGAHKDRLVGVGVVEASEVSKGKRGEAIRALLSEASVGDRFRVFARADKGKVLKTGYFASRDDDGEDDSLSMGALKSTGGPVTAEHALAWQSVQLGRIVDRLCTQSEVLLGNMGAVLQAQAVAHASLSQRHDRQTTEFMGMLREHVELEGLAAQASAELDARTDDGNGEMQRQVIDAIRGLAAQMGVGTPEPPAPE